MTLASLRYLVLVSLLICGCASGPKPGGVLSGLKTGNLKHSNSKHENELVWRWSPATPTGAPRGEVLGATISRNTLTQFIPELPQADIRLVSTHEPASVVQVTGVDGLPIKDFAQFHTAVESKLDAGKPLVVRLNTGNTEQSDIELEPGQLASLSQLVAAEENAIRVNEGGSSIFFVRQDNIRCKLMTRLEQNHGLVQVVLSLSTADGPAQLLPHEVNASFNDQPLRCLTVSETLELLYGELKSPPILDPAQLSFAETSEKEDYLLPSNFKRLQERNSDALANRSVTSRPQPALLSVSGDIYPGSAILGDARALSGMLMQRQRFSHDEQEQTGWIMFASDDLKSGGNLEIEVDFGSGPERFSFSVASL